MFDIQFIHPWESVDISTKRLSLIAMIVDRDVDIPQKWVLHVACISDEEMRTLNHTYRQKDSTTDVLSFHYFDDFSWLRKDEIAWEIVLSESRIIAQAEEHGHSIERETEILILHAVLHILGFDHETDEDYEIMWSYEEIMRENLLLTK